MGDERDVVNGDGERNPEPERRGVGRREEDVRPVRGAPPRRSAVCSHQVPVPPGMTRISAHPFAQGDVERSRRVKDESPRRRIGRATQRMQQLAEIAPDAGDLAQQLARVDRRCGAVRSPGSPPSRCAAHDMRRRAAAALAAQLNCAAAATPSSAIRPPKLRIRRTRARSRPPAPRTSSGSTRMPASPTTSGSAPRLEATTGTPTVIASSAGCRILRRATAGRASTLRDTAAGAPRRSHNRSVAPASTGFRRASQPRQQLVCGNASARR